MTKLSNTFPIALYAIAANKEINEGALVAINADFTVQEATDTANCQVIGVADCVYTDDEIVSVEDGVYSFTNSPTKTLDRGDRTKVCFVENSSTVASTSANKVVAGIVVDVDGDTVFVDCRSAAILAAKASVV